MSPSDSRVDLNQLKIHMGANLNKNENNYSTCKSEEAWNDIEIEFLTL